MHRKLNVVPHRNSKRDKIERYLQFISARLHTFWCNLSTDLSDGNHDQIRKPTQARFEASSHALLAVNFESRFCTTNSTDIRSGFLVYAKPGTATLDLRTYVKYASPAVPLYKHILRCQITRFTALRTGNFLLGIPKDFWSLATRSIPGSTFGCPVIFLWY